MAILDIGECLSFLGIKNLSSADQTRYEHLLAGADAAVKSYLKWPVERQTDFVEYYDGNGYESLILRNPFVDPDEELKVWIDMTGAYGDGPDAFAASTLITKGTHYVLKREGTMGKSGVLKRLQSSSPYWFPSDFLTSWRRSGLSFSGRPYWPAGVGNIKVQYSFGFKAKDSGDEWAMPYDLRMAVATVVGIARNTVKTGYPNTSESLVDYSYSLSISRDQQFTNVRRLLNSYRDISIGGL